MTLRRFEALHSMSTSSSASAPSPSSSSAAGVHQLIGPRPWSFISACHRIARQSSSTLRSVLSSRTGSLTMILNGASRSLCIFFNSSSSGVGSILRPVLGSIRGGRFLTLGGSGSSSCHFRDPTRKRTTSSVSKYDRSTARQASSFALRCQHTIRRLVFDVRSRLAFCWLIERICGCVFRFGFFRIVLRLIEVCLLFWVAKSRAHTNRALAANGDDSQACTSASHTKWKGVEGDLWVRKCR